MAALTPQQRLDAILAALASGVQTIEGVGRKITYRSQQELEREAARLRAQIAAESGQRRGSAWRPTFTTQRGD